MKKRVGPPPIEFSPPRDLEVERAVLGSLLHAAHRDDRAILAEFVGQLRPEDFYRGEHRVIFETIREVQDSSLVPDLITVTDRLRRNGTLDDAGGPGYVTLLMEETFGTATLRQHVQIIHRCAQKRFLAELGVSLQQGAMNGHDPAALVGFVDHALESLREDGIDLSPIERVRGRIESASELLASAGEKQEWYQWLGQQGYVGPGLTTIKSGHSKVAGKSTTCWIAIRDLLRANPGLRVLALSEEPRSVLAHRVRTGGLDAAALRFRLADGSPWPALIREIEQAAVDLVVIDTLRSFAGIKDENDAAAIVEALQPLVLYARRSNAAVVVTHHLRKSEADSGLAHAGSTALVAMADVAIEMLADASHAPNRRILKAVSRFDETPRFLTVELRGQDIVVLGTPEAVGLAEVQERVLAVLRGAAGPMTRDQVITSLGEPRPSPEQVSRALRGLHGEGRLGRVGRGVRGDPHLWALDSNLLRTSYSVEESNPKSLPATERAS